MNQATSTTTDEHTKVAAGPVLRFDLPAEADALRREPQWAEHGHHAKTLVRQADLRLVLLVMRAGARLHEHKTDNRVTIQTVTGNVQLNLPSEVVELPASAVLVLDRGIVHDVVAHEDSIVLLSINWTAG